MREKILTSREFQLLFSACAANKVDQPIVIHGAAGSLMAYVAAAAFEQRRSQVVLVGSSKDKAEMLRDDCALLLGETHVRFFGDRPTHEAQLFDMGSAIAQIEALKSLTAGLNVVVIASPQSLVAEIPAPEAFSKKVIELATRSECSFTKLITELADLGFERKEFVEGYGDFSVRGGIVDVFPYVGENPIRIEFWGDMIESMREFDALSQRSIKELEKATIVPDLDSHKTESSEQNDSAKTVSLFEYLKEDALVIFDEPEIIQREVEELHSEGGERIFGWGEIRSRAGRFAHVIHSELGSSFRHQGAEGKTAIEFGAVRQPSFNGSIKSLVGTINKLNSENIDVVLTCDTREEAERLRELIEEEILQSRTSFDEIVSETLHSGFIFPSARLAVFTEHEIFGRLKRRGTVRRRRFKGFSPKDLQQLKRGDYVVHVDYGIGRFEGLKKIKIRSAEQEVMKLLYLENDVLYVNIDYIDRVQKYSSSEGHLPNLTKLGGSDWERLKSKAKRRIKDIARDLIKLYARRKHEQGFVFSPDSHWQKELEASFMYDDTPDQARATAEVKSNMEASAPMDRLICGDVGFGKTEVAVRAAFKAVMDGKQVALLVPTTILAQQHYNTFNDRLGRYTVRVEFISRFKTKKEQQSILDDLASGSVDIVIGTHRLLSKDVRFKDLGLFIIDEEHRFGVAAKEKLRQLKATVDTLTLTATPIPRTLHFSLMGARDISLINTPPRNRLPIVTEIVQFDWRIIREAIVRELHRGGQAYFVHDRVQKIEDLKELLQEHIPEARFAVAHGQMRGHSLEKVMIDFLERKYDVLVCTKIIESGIDIPNVNTILINRADHFGMAELYQLRGRVGRSNVQAYAFLLTPPISILPKPTIRRLQAIEEFTELGSGFNLAMRDLEIRGAGNLLGAEQSGFIMEMGFEMYERVVREAVEELKREEFGDVFESTPISPAALPLAVVESDFDAYIPDFYIESDTDRLEIYRRLARSGELHEVHEVRAELRDRFGEYPPEVENLLLVVELRLLASRVGLQKVSVDAAASTAALSLTLPNDDRFFAETIVNKLSHIEGASYRLKQDKKSVTLIVEGRAHSNGSARLTAAKHILTKLVETP